MKPAEIREIEEVNELAARTILADPRCDGLQLIWARSWRKHHPHAADWQIIERLEETPGEKIARQMRRREEYRLRKRRQRWMTRTWHESLKGNYFVRVDNFVVVVYRVSRGWMIRIEDKNRECSEVSRRRYDTLGDAQAGAFDGLVYMEAIRERR
jgi:hypothetical protein